jgi:hypothetical protein
MDNRELKIQVSPLGPGCVDKKDATKNPSLLCGISFYK